MRKTLKLRVTKRDLISKDWNTKNTIIQTDENRVCTSPDRHEGAGSMSLNIWGRTMTVKWTG